MPRGRNEYHGRDELIDGIIRDPETTIDEKVDDIACVQYMSVCDFSEYLLKQYADTDLYFDLYINMPLMLLNFVKDSEEKSK